MNHEPKFRYYKLDADGQELLRAYKAELEALVEDRQALEREFAERAEQQSQYHQAKLRALWQRLSASVGLDPDKTWGSPEYQIEARYLDDGFGALLYMPRHTNPMREMLGGEPVGTPSDPAIDIPPKDTTRH
jgi:hypothetical protein